MFGGSNLGKNYGYVLNLLVGAVGIIVVLFGVVFRTEVIPSTICVSVGTSMLATALVTEINKGYLLKSQRMEKLMSTWRIRDMYETKADMNTIDANAALDRCSESIDIIGEGLSGYISVKGDILRRKILENGVKVRIISCDSEMMLKARAKDEFGDECDGGDAVRKVRKLKKWVEDLQGELADRKDNIEIRYHGSYPGMSYLRIDRMVFVSANLLQRQSQHSFALSFEGDGKGSRYFNAYFEELWKEFTHKECEVEKENK